MSQNSAKYWDKHSARLMYSRMESAEEISAEIAEIYRTAYNQISHDISTLYKQFRTDFSLSEKEAMQLLNTLQDPTDLKALYKALTNKGTPEALRLKAALNAPEYQRDIARLQALQQKINDISRDIYKQDLSAQRKWYTGLCHDTYYRTIYDVQRQVGFQFSFAHIDDKLIRRIISTKWDGSGYSTRLWHNINGVSKEVQKQLTLGLISGKTEKQMADEIANKYAQGAFESRRLVRTESCYLSNEIQMTAYEECEAERYQYVATLDSKTDEECGELDRKTFLVKNRRPGINCPPMHPFCRCTTKIYLGQNTRADLRRRARDPKTGKNIIVPAHISYKQWAKDNGITPKK